MSLRVLCGVFLFLLIHSNPWLLVEDPVELYGEPWNPFINFLYLFFVSLRVHLPGVAH